MMNPTLVAALPGRALVAHWMRSALQWAQPAPRAPRTPAEEAAAVRALADQHRLSDPRFANDLYAAADRHELLHDAMASALQGQQSASAVDYS